MAKICAPVPLRQSSCAQFFKGRVKKVGCIISCSLRKDSQDWFSKNVALVRTAPVAIGIGSFGFVLFNRALSGVPPVVDASSSQSRTDVLVLALSATVLLTGLIWISIQPKRFKPVELQGVKCTTIEAPSQAAKRELIWSWEVLIETTCTGAIVVVYNNRCIFQAGLAAESPDQPGEPMHIDVELLMKGSLYSSCLTSGKQSYLANLSLFPARYELPFLPSNTQAVIIQPLGSKGVFIAGGNRIRGFSNTDQAWISTIGEKLDVTLESSFTKPFS